MDVTSSVYRMSHCFEYMFYQPAMHYIQLRKSKKGEATTILPSSVTNSMDPLKPKTGNLSANTEGLSADGTGGGPSTSTAKTICDSRSSLKRRAPEDKRLVTVQCHDRPVDNRADCNTVPTVQLLGHNAVGPLPKLAFRPGNQDMYLEPFNNINAARRDYTNIESNVFPPPHYDYHPHHVRPVHISSTAMAHKHHDKFTTTHRAGHSKRLKLHNLSIPATLTSLPAINLPLCIATSRSDADSLSTRAE